MNHLNLKLMIMAWLSGLWLPTPCLAMDLNEVLVLALERDAGFQAELYDADARNAEGWGDIAGLGPTLSAAGSYMQSRDSLSPAEDSELESRSAHFGEGEVIVDFNQPLVDLEKYSLAARGGRTRELSGILRKKAREDLLLRVHQRYYEVLAAQVNLGLTRAESEALERQVQAARDKLEIGFGIVTDVYDAEARYRLSRANELVGEAQLDASRQALTELIAREIEEDLDDLRGDFVLPVPEGAIDLWLSLAEKHNSDYAISRMEREVAEFDYRAAQSKFTPALVLFAGYEQRNPDGGLYGYGEERIEANVGLRLEMDILNGGADLAAAVAAGNRNRAARQRSLAARRATIRAVRTTWDTLNSTRALVAAYQEAVRSNEQALASTKAAYREGVKILLDVLNAQRDYFDALASYRNARYDYMVLLARFESYVGVPVRSLPRGKGV